jgi:hypothetical protein
VGGKKNIFEKTLYPSNKGNTAVHPIICFISKISNLTHPPALISNLLAASEIFVLFFFPNGYIFEAVHFGPTTIFRYPPPYIPHSLQRKAKRVRKWVLEDGA